MRKPFVALALLSVVSLSSANVAFADLVTYNLAFTSGTGLAGGSGSVTINTGQGFADTTSIYTDDVAGPGNIGYALNDGLSSVEIAVDGATFTMANLSSALFVVSASGDYFNADGSYTQGVLHYNFTASPTFETSRSATTTFVPNAGSYGLGIGNSATFMNVGDFGPFTITEASTTVTPEPSTFVLLGTGLLGVAGAARRRFGVRT